MTNPEPKYEKISTEKFSEQCGDIYDIIMLMTVDYIY